MAFTRKRGRPKNPTPAGDDRGTPELVRKRTMALTKEALDLCLERNLITQEQHWCGIHLRWLYTLRYGAPTLRAVDPLHFGGRELMQESPDWRREREREFNEAIAAMGPLAWKALALCVYNQRPACLSFANAALSIKKGQKNLAAHEREMDTIRACLDRLIGLWCRRKKGIRH